MSREGLLHALNRYTTAYPTEACFAPRFVSLLNNFPTCFRRDLLSGHITGSAWVVCEDFDKVVLLHHKKLDRWLQPGGHADGEEDVLKVATKELVEETGLSAYCWVTTSIFDIDIHQIPGNGVERPHFHYDIRFIAAAPSQAPLIGNKESKAVKWVPLNNITEANGFEESILRMVEKTKRLKELR